MATYLYGLILARNVVRIPAGLAGLRAEPIRALPCAGGLAGLVGTIDRRVDRSALADIRAHDAALRGAVRAGITVAAARFGQHFDADADVCTSLSEHGMRTVALLEQFDECVEMRVVLSIPHETASIDAAGGASSGGSAGMTEGPGHAYLNRLRRRAAVPPIPVSIRPALGPMVRAERVERLAGRPDGVATPEGVVISHLVHRDDVASYRDAVSALPALADARVDGPLPLYAFAEPDAT